MSTSSDSQVCFCAGLRLVVPDIDLKLRFDSWPNDSLTQVGRYVADRAGVLATAQVAPVILLSGRNNPVVYLTGATFNTCMLYHRWFSRYVFGQAVVHAM